MVYYDKRIFSEQSLQFTVECGGGNRQSVSCGYGGEENLIKIGKMIAKEAANVYKWELPRYRPVYVLITINLRMNKNSSDEEREWRDKLIAHRMIPVRTPSTHRVTDMVIRMLTGPVIETPAQVCAIMAIKKQSKDREFIEVFVGAPTDWSELNHDIRNG